jgi:hypothetical protein
MSEYYNLAGKTVLDSSLPIDLEIGEKTKRGDGAKQLPDSGVREDFETGAVREIVPGKGRYDLISPRAMHRLALRLEQGAVKYSDRNWEKGIPLSSFLNSAFRHLYQFLDGDKTEDHLAAALWNIHSLIHTEEMIAEGQLPASLNDLPDRGE